MYSHQPASQNRSRSLLLIAPWRRKIFKIHPEEAGRSSANTKEVQDRAVNYRVAADWQQARRKGAGKISRGRKFSLARRQSRLQEIQRLTEDRGGGAALQWSHIIRDTPRRLAARNDFVYSRRRAAGRANNSPIKLTHARAAPA